MLPFFNSSLQTKISLSLNLTYEHEGYTVETTLEHFIKHMYLKIYRRSDLVFFMFRYLYRELRKFSFESISRISTQVFWTRLSISTGQKEKSFL